MILLSLFTFLLGLSWGGVAVNLMWGLPAVSKGWLKPLIWFTPAIPGLLALLLLPIHARAVILALKKAGKAL